MTTEEFADRLRDLVVEAEGAGLSRPQVVALLQEQMMAMQETEPE